MRTLLAFLFFLFAAGLPAQDDRDRTTPTDWVWFHDVTASTLTALVNVGWRFTDLDVEGNSKFSVAAVKNTGAYAKTWYYWIGVTDIQLATNLAQTNSRLVDIELDGFNGSQLFAAIAIENTGADQKNWWWFTDLLSSQVVSTAASLGARPILVRPIVIAGQLRCLTVMIDNSGADHRAWTRLTSATGASLAASIAQTSFRPYSVCQVGSNLFDVILVDNTDGFENWYMADGTPSNIGDFVAQKRGRVVDFEKLNIAGVDHCFAIVLDNTNDLEKKARQEFESAIPAIGPHGFLLRELGGATLARMRDGERFEATGTIATLEHAHAMRRVSQGFAPFGPFLSTQITKPAACVGGGPSQSLELTLRQMMENSDDFAELAIENAFTPASITGAMPTFGMLSTTLGSPASCGGLNTNSTTLTDLAALHEQVASGALNNVTDQRAKFYELMDESLTSFGAWGTTTLNAKIDAEAVAIGMPVAVRDNFKSQLHVAFRSGVAGHPAPNPEYHCSTFGWMRVPFRSFLGVLAPREFVFGAYNDGYTQLEPIGRAAMADAAMVLVWDRVQAAMQSWGDYTPGSIVSMPGSGCAGSAGTPLHTTVGLPDLHGAVDYKVSNAPANALVVAMFGFSSTQWNGTPLPADLAPIGASGCVLRTDPSVLFAMIASPAGTTTKSIAIGTNPSLVGTIWYSQFLVFDPPANAFGATLSNAKKTTVGGFF